jgi:uncharacterized membrane protein YfcA
MALGTSLAVIVVTSISSIWSHHQRGAVRWDLVFSLLPGLCLGVGLGTVAAASIEARQLQQSFGVFAILVAIQMGFSLQPAGGTNLPGRIGQILVGTVIGWFSALFGIGGGSLTVPFLSWCRIRMQEAVATAAAVGLPIALVGTAGYIWQGNAIAALPSYSSGYIYWPAWGGMAVSSVFFARLGVKLAHQLPSRRLKQIFALFLVLVGIHFLFGDIISAFLN